MALKVGVYKQPSQLHIKNSINFSDFITKNILLDYLVPEKIEKSALTLPHA